MFLIITCINTISMTFTTEHETDDLHNMQIKAIKQ